VESKTDGVESRPGSVESMSDNVAAEHIVWSQTRCSAVQNKKRGVRTIKCGFQNDYVELRLFSSELQT
jgi:hypothetical protein